MCSRFEGSGIILETSADTIRSAVPVGGIEYCVPGIPASRHLASEPAAGITAAAQRPYPYFVSMPRVRVASQVFRRGCRIGGPIRTERRAPGFPGRGPRHGCCRRRTRTEAFRRRTVSGRADCPTAPCSPPENEAVSCPAGKYPAGRLRPRIAASLDSMTGLPGCYQPGAL